MKNGLAFPVVTILHPGASKMVGSLVLFLYLASALAAPDALRLDAARSGVGFSCRLIGYDTRGAMPVTSADVAIDRPDFGADGYPA